MECEAWATITGFFKPTTIDALVVVNNSGEDEKTWLATFRSGLETQSREVTSVQAIGSRSSGTSGRGPEFDQVLPGFGQSWCEFGRHC